MDLCSHTTTVSLQATYIRNTILHSLRTTTKLSVHDVPLNFVYTNPTVISLATYVLGLLNGQGIDNETERGTHIAQMETLLTKYSAELKKPQWTSSRASSASSEETVMITASAKSQTSCRCRRAPMCTRKPANPSNLAGHCKVVGGS